MMLHAVHTTQLSGSNYATKFAVFITPEVPLNQLLLWLQQNSISVPAEEFYGQRGANVNGLVVDITKGNSLHIFCI